MITLTIIIFILLFTTTISAVYIAAYLAGADKVKTKMIVDARRREKRVARERFLWQDAFVRKTGGSLKPPPPKEKPEPPRRVVSASQVVTELKKVPPKVEEGFLKDTAEFARY